MTTIDDLKKDNIFTESNNIRLRKLTGEDRSDFFRVLKAISSMPALYELDRVNELIWKEILSSDTVIAFAVEKKEQAVYAGNCMVKHPEDGMLELGMVPGDIFNWTTVEVTNDSTKSDGVRVVREGSHVVNVKLHYIIYPRRSFLLPRRAA